MGIFQNLNQKPFIKKTLQLLDRIIIPGTNGISLLQLMKVYIKGIKKLELGNKVAAISWRLFLSLFPFMLFFIIFIQYLPYFDELLKYFYSEFLNKIVPPQIADTTWSYLSTRQTDILAQYKNKNLIGLWVSILVFLITSTQGIQSLLQGLNNSEELFNRQRKGLKQFGISTFITILLTVLMIISLLTFYYVDVIADVLESQNIHFFLQNNLFNWIRFLVFLFTYFTGICIIYYFGPKVHLSLQNIFPGAILTTILYLILTYVFGIYISKLAQFNLLYGSLGSILIVMIWLYLNVMLLIIGYELNISIIKSKEIRTKDE